MRSLRWTNSLVEIGGICCEICHTLQDDHLSNTFYPIDKLCSPKSMTNCETLLPNNDSKCFKPHESGKGFTRDAWWRPKWMWFTWTLATPRVGMSSPLALSFHANITEARKRILLKSRTARQKGFPQSWSIL